MLGWCKFYWDFYDDSKGNIIVGALQYACIKSDLSEILDKYLNQMGLVKAWNGLRILLNVIINPLYEY